MSKLGELTPLPADYLYPGDDASQKIYEKLSTADKLSDAVAAKRARRVKWVKKAGKLADTVVGISERISEAINKRSILTCHFIFYHIW